MKTQGSEFRQKDWKWLLIIAFFCLLSNRAEATSWGGTLSSGMYTFTTSGDEFKVNNSTTTYSEISIVYIDGTSSILCSLGRAR